MTAADTARRALFDETLRRAVELHQRGELGHARALYEGAMTLEPEHPDPPQLLGTLAAQAGDYARAVQLLEHSLRLKPGQPLVLTNLGNVCIEAGEPAAGLRCFEEALRHDGALLRGHLGRAMALANLGRFEESLVSADAALALDARDLDGLLQRGAALLGLRRQDEAVRTFELAVSAHEAHAGAWVSLGSAALEFGDRSRARAAFARARALDPDSLSANLGCLQGELTPLAASRAEFDGAEPAFRAELERFSHWGRTVGLATDVARSGGPTLFYLAYRPGPVERPLAEAGVAISAVMARWRRERGVGLADRRPADAPGRIGIVSAHVREHSVYDVITRGLITAIAAAGFEARLYCVSAEADAETGHAAARAGHCLRGPRPLADWMRLIAADGCDVLLYPEVGMDDVTLKLAATRLAPVQAVAWGHPVTSGLPTLDYYLSAEAFEPADADSHYAERLVRLPNLGCELQSGSLVAMPAGVTDLHLPSLGLDPRVALFLCPGTPFKYLPADDDVLVDIALRLGRCQFVLFELSQRPDLSVRTFERVARAFEARGLDWTHYLRLLPWQPKATFRSLCRQATAVLDTIGFSGFNTAVHALQSGVPVVGFEASRLRGRLASGTLRYLGLAELVADDHASYVTCAVRLAEDRAHAAAMRQKIAASIPRLHGDRTVTDALVRFLAGAVSEARTAR